MPTTQPTVRIGDLLRVTNEDTRIFRGMWDLVDYVIPPGGEEVMPFEAVKCFFGDPRAGKDVARVVDRYGQSGYLPDRASEVRRLRLLYAHGFGDYTGQEGPERVWEPNKVPHVRVETLKGERLLTVIDDPAGDSIALAGTTVSESENLKETVREQGRIIQALMQRLGVSDITDTPRNVYKPDEDVIEPYEERDPAANPEIFDDLPEDR
jgi:hypothetical protein